MFKIPDELLIYEILPVAEEIPERKAASQNESPKSLIFQGFSGICYYSKSIMRNEFLLFYTCIYKMVPMMTPLDSGVGNVGMCLAGGAIFSAGIGAVSSLILNKVSLVG